MLLIRRFLTGLEGATAIEYCLIAGIISIAIVFGARGIGTHLNAYYGAASTGLN